VGNLDSLKELRKNTHERAKPFNKEHSAHQCERGAGSAVVSGAAEKAEVAAEFGGHRPLKGAGLLSMQSIGEREWMVGMK
jgi:hypothetical protein